MRASCAPVRASFRRFPGVLSGKAERPLRGRKRLYGACFRLVEPTGAAYAFWRMISVMKSPAVFADAAAATTSAAAMGNTMRRAGLMALGTPAPHSPGSRRRPPRRPPRPRRRRRALLASRARQVAQQRRTRRIRGAPLPRGPCNPRLLAFGERYDVRLREAVELDVGRLTHFHRGDHCPRAPDQHVPELAAVWPRSR